MSKRTIKLILIAMAWVVSFAANATPLDDIQRQVKEALCDGNMQQFSSLFDNNVEINIMETNKAKYKNQAVSIIQNYINRNRPSNFIVTHKTEKMQSGYLIGKLQTSSGQHQIHIMLKKGVSNNFTIYQLTITQ